LEEMDIRDFDFWHRKAKVKVLERKIENLTTARIAMNGSAEDMNDALEILGWQIKIAEGEEEDNE
jgi:hypothetical protein